jgi:Cu+-exporting ATPase
VRDGAERELPVEDVVTGDIVLVRPGSRVPVDGVVLEGVSAVDESALTGRVFRRISFPEAPFTPLRSTVRAASHPGHFGRRGRNAGADHPPCGGSGRLKGSIARLADRVAGIFVPAVIGIALLTVVIWLLTGASFSFALTRGVAVLVISCPCALGLATPFSIMVGTGRGAEYGVLFQSAAALEALCHIDTMPWIKPEPLPSVRLM